MKIFKNWSGSMDFTLGEVFTPESEEQVCELVKKATSEVKKSVQQGQDILHHRW